MKYVVILISGLLLHGATALAQEEAGAVAEPTADSEPATQPPEKEAKKRSPYYRKARGWLWIEGIAGVSAYDPDSFGSLSISSIENAPKVTGPEYGFAVGTPFGGPFFLGFFYRQANYGQYKLLKTGLDMQGSIMIPYVHIIHSWLDWLCQDVQRQSVRPRQRRESRLSVHGWLWVENSDHPLDLVCDDFRLDLHRLVDARRQPERRQQHPELDQRATVRRDLCPHLPVHRGSQGLALAALRRP